MKWIVLVILTDSFIANIKVSGEAECRDQLTKENPLTVPLDKPEKDLVYTRCAQIVRDYPGLCQSAGKPGGYCCKACKKYGTPDCLDKAGNRSPLYVTVNGKTKKLRNCQSLRSKDNIGFCSPDVFGGKGNQCCKTCSAAPHSCINKVTRKKPLSITLQGRTKTLTSCRMLSENKYQSFCSPDVFGGNRSACCFFCLDKCVDAVSWKTTNQVKVCKDCTCAEVAAKGLMQECCTNGWKGRGANNKLYTCTEACCESCTKLNASR